MKLHQSKQQVSVLTSSQAEGLTAPPAGSRGTCDITTHTNLVRTGAAVLNGGVCVFTEVFSHSSDLVLGHLWRDASDEQGGGEVERTGLRWSLLLSFLSSFLATL